VKAAFSRSLVEEEARREKELEAMIAALRKSQYRCVCKGWQHTLPLPAHWLLPLTLPHTHTLLAPLPNRAPQKPLECQVEEAAVLACKAPADCAPVIDAYVSCARKVVDSLMKPKLG
jgi:hypothetical protein